MTSINRGQFTSWHMERKADNKYGPNDQTTKPAPGAREKYLVTDGRPAGTHFRANAWHVGEPGDRGARAHELAGIKNTAYGKQGPADAPWMKGDRSRNADGRLRQVRADALIGNNKTIQARAPELISALGADTPVAALRGLFAGLSVSKISDMSQSERAAVLGAAVGAAS